MARRLLESNRHWQKAGMAALSLAITLVVALPSASPQTVKSHEEAARVLTVEKILVTDGAVSGEVYNRSTRLVREVQLLIRYTWLWDDEMHPGKIDPGISAYYTLPQEIPAGGRVPFSFKPSPVLAKFAGGRYETSVIIAGFTEVIPQTK